MRELLARKKAARDLQLKHGSAVDGVPIAVTHCGDCRALHVEARTQFFVGNFTAREFPQNAFYIMSA